MRGETPGSVVSKFFDAYRAHDVEQMVSLCDDMADFRYVPVEMWGRQRVLRGDGKVRSIGKVLWTGMIESFPDLNNTVNLLIEGEEGDVAAEVTFSGNQAKAWGPIGPSGKSFAVPHLFLFNVNESGRITDIRAYWDGASMNQQLGRMEID
jgi:steroid delta-isomerase-like uncharacterized protein